MKNNSLFVLYKNPADFPGLYVLREHEWTGESYKPVPGEPAVKGPNLEPIKKLMASIGKQFILRYTSDDPAIVGTYL